MTAQLHVLRSRVTLFNLFISDSDSFKGSQVLNRSIGLLFVGRFHWYNDMGLNSPPPYLVFLNERHASASASEPPRPSRHTHFQTRMAPGLDDCSCSRLHTLGRLWPVFILDHQLSLLILPPWHPQHSHSLCFLQQVFHALNEPAQREPRASPDALRHFYATKRDLQQGDASHAW